MTTLPAITAHAISKRYLIYEKPIDRLKQVLYCGRRSFFREHTALENVSFTINRGETIGIVGRNGSGKSTLLQIISGTATATGGEVITNGRICALLELGAGFNPDFTGRENIYLNATILGLTKSEIDERYEQIVLFSGLEQMSIEQPVKSYSSGMVVRLAFAVAIHTKPDILIVDEAMSVGDEAFQQKCFMKIKSIQESGATILFVSHDANSVVRICNRALLMDNGKLIAEGSPKSIITQYHRLIFAPVEKQAAIAQEIANNKQQEETVTNLIDELKPESTQYYESCGAVIRNPRIETQDGTPVNLLMQRMSYYFVYDVAFSEDASNVGFGMMLRTYKGMDLGGSFSNNSTSASIAHVRGGSVWRVRFEFMVLLEPGTYTLNCGCVGTNSQAIGSFLHRITDAVMFKVYKDTNSYQTGLIDFMIEPKVSEISDPA